MGSSTDVQGFAAFANTPGALSSVISQSVACGRSAVELRWGGGCGECLFLGPAPPPAVASVWIPGRRLTLVPPALPHGTSFQTHADPFRRLFAPQE